MSKKCIEPPSPREQPVAFAEKFGHAGVGARSARQRVGVIAISGDEVIVGPRGRDRAGDDRFLADVKMTEAADLLRLILLARALLKTPDQQHQRRASRLRRVAPRGCMAVRQRAAAPRLRVSVPRCGRSSCKRRRAAVKSRSLTSELRKNIQVGVALYCGKPTVSAWIKPAKFFT